MALFSILAKWWNPGPAASRRSVIFSNLESEEMPPQAIIDTYQPSCLCAVSYRRPLNWRIEAVTPNPQMDPESSPGLGNPKSVPDFGHKSNSNCHLNLYSWKRTPYSGFCGPNKTKFGYHGVLAWGSTCPNPPASFDWLHSRQTVRKYRDSVANSER